MILGSWEPVLGPGRDRFIVEPYSDEVRNFRPLPETRLLQRCACLAPFFLSTTTQ